MKFLEVELRAPRIIEQKEFYSNIMGMQPDFNTPVSYSVRAGETLLKFTESNLPEVPYYHFAFNIPENQLYDAIKWLNNKVKLIEYEGSPVIDFPNWNAHSVYFYDPAGNIVELIARHNLNNSSTEPFSAASLLNISEVGLPVESVKDFINLAEDKLNEKLWWGNLETFAAIGNEEGLLIAVTTKRNWFPTEKPCNIFPLKVKISKGNQPVKLIEYSEYKIIG